MTILSISALLTVSINAKVPEEKSLSDYIEKNYPNTYKDFKNKGIDINELEKNKSNDNNLINHKEDIKYSIAKGEKTKNNARNTCKKYSGIFIENDYLATCVSKDGTFGNGRNLLGMTFNPNGTGTVYSPDFLIYGSPFEYFSVSLGKTVYSNKNNNGGDLSGDTIKNTFIKPLDRSNNSSQEGGVLVHSIIQKGKCPDVNYNSLKKIKYQCSRLDIKQKYTIDPNSKEIIIRVIMENTGMQSIKDIKYSRGLDPDQDMPSTYSTLNQRGHHYPPNVHVKAENIAFAVGKETNYSVALYSVDPLKHNTCISQNWSNNPNYILSDKCRVYPNAQTYPSMNYSDSTINIGFDVGTLSPREKKVFTFKYLFNKFL